MLLPAERFRAWLAPIVLRRDPPELVIGLAVEPFLAAITDRIEEGEGEAQPVRRRDEAGVRLVSRLIEDAEGFEDELVADAHSRCRT